MSMVEGYLNVTDRLPPEALTYLPKFEGALDSLQELFQKRQQQQPGPLSGHGSSGQMDRIRADIQKRDEWLASQPSPEEFEQSSRDFGRQAVVKANQKAQSNFAVRSDDKGHQSNEKIKLPSFWLKLDHASKVMWLRDHGYKDWYMYLSPNMRSDATGGISILGGNNGRDDSRQIARMGILDRAAREQGVPEAPQGWNADLGEVVEDAGPPPGSRQSIPPKDDSGWQQFREDKQASLEGYMCKEGQVDRVEHALDFGERAFPDYFSGDPNRRKILEETVNTETLRGTYKPTSPGGFWQVTEDTFNNIQSINPAKHPKTHGRIKNNALGMDLSKVKYEQLSRSPHLSALFAALKYMTVEDPIPNTLEDRAKYWKEYYNTVKGKGTPERYIQDNKIHGR